MVGYFLEQVSHYSTLNFKIKLSLSSQLDDSLENQALLGGICFLNSKIFFLHSKSKTRVSEPGFLLPSVSVHREERISGISFFIELTEDYFQLYLTYRKKKTFQCTEDFESAGGDEIRVTLPGSLRWSQMLLDQRRRERE